MELIRELVRRGREKEGWRQEERQRGRMRKGKREKPFSPALSTKSGV